MRLARTRFLKDRPLSRLIQHSTNGINLFMCPISERHVRNITHLTTFDKLDYAAKNPYGSNEAPQLRQLLEMLYLHQVRNGALGKSQQSPGVDASVPDENGAGASIRYHVEEL